jgi:hypothetical protein
MKPDLLKKHRTERDKFYAEGSRTMRKRLKNFPEKDAEADAKREQDAKKTHKRVIPNQARVVSRQVDDAIYQGVYREGDRVNPPKGKTHLLRKINRAEKKIARPEKGQGFKKTRITDLPKLSDRQFETLKTRLIRKISNMAKGYLTIEATAIEEQCHPNHIRAIFKELNLLGVLDQKTRSHAHDTNRNNMFPGSQGGWAANKYHIIPIEHRKPRKAR